MESQVPVASKLEAKYQTLAKVEKADLQAEKAFKSNVESLAQQSVEERAVAVADMSKVPHSLSFVVKCRHLISVQASQELQQARLHQKIASVLTDKAVLLRARSNQLTFKAQVMRGHVALRMPTCLSRGLSHSQQN